MSNPLDVEYTVTVQQLREAGGTPESPGGLAQLLALDIQIPSTFRYKVSRAKRKIDNARKDFNFEETRNKLIKKYGKKNNEGEWQIKPEMSGYDNYREAIEKELNAEVTVMCPTLPIDPLLYKTKYNDEGESYQVERQDNLAFVFYLCDWLIDDSDLAGESKPKTKIKKKEE